jgi:probable phosphoglycerate mutase
VPDRHARIVIVRHGETEWSREGRHTGRQDIPLTDAGRDDARHLAAALQGFTFARVLCSPLQRARETCRLAGCGDEAELRDELQEWDYGDYEGLTFAEVQARRPGWFLWRDGCPGGESPDDVGRRVDPLVAELTEQEADVVVFAHGHVLRVLASRWIGRPAGQGARLALSTSAISVLGYEHDLPVIRRWNDQGHLPADRRSS